MELVTLGSASLYRIGSASGVYTNTHQEFALVTEIPDASRESLRELVLSVAESKGEAREKLASMWEETPAWNFTQQKGAIVFNIQGLNVQYGTPYAICYAFPALKISNRYFRLEEIAQNVTR